MHLTILEDIVILEVNSSRATGHAIKCLIVTKAKRLHQPDLKMIVQS